MSDNQKLQIAIEAVNHASAALKQVGQDADAMGKQVEQAGKRGAAGLDQLKNRSTAVGAAIGTVVAGAALTGQAYVAQEQQVRALSRSYGDSTNEILRFSEELQRNTVYSNDAARQSAIYSSSLIQNYDLTAKQITQLIERSADLAAVNVTAEGTQIALTDAVSRASSAIRGEAEAGELLGLSMSDTFLKTEAAKRGLTGWSTTMTEAEKAQFRFTIMMEQSSYAIGAAGEAADTSAGRAQKLKNEIQDLAQTAGGVLGPMGEYAAVLGQWALLAPAAGAALGKVASGLSAMGLKPGMLGPAALLVGGASLAYGYSQDDIGTTKTNEFWNQFFMTGSKVMNAVIPFGDPYDESKYTDQMNQNAVGDMLMSYFALPGGDANAAVGMANLVLGSPGLQSGGVFNYDADDLKDYIIESARASGMRPEAWLQQQIDLAVASDPNLTTTPTGQVSTIAGYRDYQLGLIQAPTSYVGSPGTSGLERAAGMQTGPAAPWFPRRDANPQADYLGYQAEIQELQGQIDTALIEYLNSGAVEAVDLLRAAYPGAPINQMKKAGGGFSYSAEDGTTVGSGFYGRTAEDGTRVPQEFYAPQPNYTPFDVQAERSGQARSNFQTGYGVTIGQTQGMAGDSQQLSDFTKDLVNEEGVLGKWDDLVSRGVIDTATQQWASYANVQGEANKIFATNQEIQDDTAVIQLKQLGYMADLQEEYGATIDEISRMDEAEQRRTLAMMDSGEQTKVSEAATIAYRVATGELSESIGTDLIKGMAQADPLFADLAEKYGMISYGAEGEVIVNFPDKDSLIEGVGELNENLGTLIELLASYFNIDIESNAPEVTGDVATLRNEVFGLDGTGATVTIDADTSPFWGKVNGLLGQTVGTAYLALDYLGIAGQRNGGVVGYARGGVVAELAEAGPELLHFRGGGSALAVNRGLYAVPQGTYVDTAPATKSKLGGMGGVQIANATFIFQGFQSQSEVQRQIQEFAMGSTR